MIQYGIIKELKPEENSAIVRIPMYETSQGEEALFNCVLTVTPGIINGYTEGDIVTVGFENDDLDSPFVLNKLFTGISKEQNSETSAFLDNLYVEGTAEFSENFKVGEVTYKDLLSLKKNLNITENSTDAEKSIVEVDGNTLSNGKFSQATLYYVNEDSDDNLFEEDNLYLGQAQGNISKVALTAVPMTPAITNWVVNPRSIEYGYHLTQVNYSYTLRRPQDFSTLKFSSDNDSSDPDINITPILGSGTGTVNSHKGNGFNTRTFKLKASLNNGQSDIIKSSTVDQLYRQFLYATNETNTSTILANLKDVTSSTTYINTYLQNNYPSDVQMSLGNDYKYVYFIMDSSQTITQVTDAVFGFGVPVERVTNTTQFTNQYNYQYSVNIYKTVNKINGDINFNIN